MFSVVKSLFVSYLQMKTGFLFVETFILEVTVLEKAHADSYILIRTYRYCQLAELIVFWSGKLSGKEKIENLKLPNV